MNNKDSKIYKKSINSLKTDVQNEYYYHANRADTTIISKDELINKINDLFKRPDFVYQIDTNIMYKNGEIKSKKVIGFKNNYLITIDDERTPLSDISDIK